MDVSLAKAYPVVDFLNSHRKACTAMIGVEDVCIDCDSPLVRIFSLEEPVPGRNIDSFCLRVSGALELVNCRLKRLDLVVGGIVLHSVSHLSDFKFSLDLNVIGIPETFCFEIVAHAAEDGCDIPREIPLASVRGNRTFTKTRQPLKRAPLILLSVGRAGSTALMNLLRRHPGIVCHETYPFELNFCAYWMHLLRVLTCHGDHLNSVNAANYWASLWYVGCNPYNHADYLDPGGEVRRWLDSTAIVEFAGFCQRNIDEVYDRLALENGKPASNYFVEKIGPGYVPWLCWEFYDKVREIILVRDVRDWLCSRLSFFRSKVEPHQLSPAAPDEIDWLREQLRALPHLEAAWQSRRDRAHLLKYEDLICDPLRAMRSVLSYLELDVVPPFDCLEDLKAAAMQGIPQRHRTYSEDSVTIGRWKKDLDPRIIDACGEEINRCLDLFGYEI